MKEKATFASQMAWSLEMTWLSSWQNHVNYKILNVSANAINQCLNVAYLPLSDIH